MSTSPPQFDSLIARRVRKGNRRDESEGLLQILLQRHSGDNLVHALVYEGFATERQAEAFVAERKGEH